MKIYVTGGTGFVGSHLAHKLVWAGHDVTLGGLNPERTPIDLPENTRVEQIDITDPETLDFSSHDAVIHLVGLSPLFKPRISYHSVHVEGTVNVMDACKEADIESYIHMSALGASPKEDTEYLRSKGEAEILVKNSELNWTIVRPSVIFGKGGQFLSFTESLLTPFITGLPNGGKNKFQPLYVEDISDLFVEIVEDKKHAGKVYNFGGPEIYSLHDIAKLIEKSKGRSLKVLTIPMPLTKVAMTVSDRLGLKFGLDQYRSLKKDNVTEENSITQFKKPINEMKTLPEYLGL